MTSLENTTCECPKDTSVALGDREPAQADTNELDVINTLSEPSVKSEESLFSRSSLELLVVPLVCGMFYGYNIVFVAVFYEMHKMAMSCNKAGAPESCETLSYADCRWFGNGTHGGYCGWTDITCRVLYPNSIEFGGSAEVAEAACRADSRCTWSYADSECGNPVGFDSLHYAIFAAAMTTGGVFGSFIGSPVVQQLGSKLSFLISGTVGCVCCLMYHVAIDTNDYWTLISSRLVMGLCVGVTGVASPLYINQNAPKHLKKPMGYIYMISICIGMLGIAIMGLATGQSADFSDNTNLHMMGRIQATAALASALSVSVVVLGLFAKETCINFNLQHHIQGAVNVDPNEYSYSTMFPRLMIAFVMACTFQLTGANSISSYAPTIMGNLGLAPLVGTFLMMLVCLIGAIASVQLSTRFSSRSIFLCGSFITGAVCIGLCGIPVYPGVAPDNVKNVVAVVGTLLFMGFFQLCLGPCFYVLTQEVFPLSFRPKGASFTQTSQFALKVVVCVSYPFATQGLSGGAGGNQNKGQSLVFLFFGVIGLVCFVIEYFFLHPWEKP